MYFGGAEGGATHSNLLICDENGKVVGKSKGLGTNHWVLGIDECANRVVKMVHDAKGDAGIPLDRPLDSLGLTLSGCGQDSSNAELAETVREKDPHCAKAIYVATDTAGSLFTGAPNGGMVLIAGTGSNALLRTPEGKHYGCGGWGYLLGDEGGAYWIAHRAVKAVFDDIDGLRAAPHPVKRVWDTVQEHFGVDNRDDLLPHAYKHFDKSMFAGLAVKLSALAYQGDPLSLHILSEAGSALAAHVVALCGRANCHRLRVVCVGSVWKSWRALRPGLERGLRGAQLNTELEFVKLRVSSAIGAAWLAARHVNYSLPRDDSAYCEVFYTYEPDIQTDSQENGTADNHVPNGKDNGVKQNGGENGATQNGDAKVNRFESVHQNGTVSCGCGDWSTWS